MPHEKDDDHDVNDDDDDVNHDDDDVNHDDDDVKHENNNLWTDDPILSHMYSSLLTYHIDIKESWQPFIVGDMLQLCIDNFTRLLVESFVIPFWIQHVQS